MNITSVNITWNYPPTQPPTQFIVQSYSTAALYHNISQMLNSTYYLYNGMAMGSFYIFRVIAYQSGVASTPSDETDVFVNGANGISVDISDHTLYCSTLFSSYRSS